MTNPTPLSPAAYDVLTAVTLTKYDVPPEGLPVFAEEMAPLISAALRAAADQVVPEHFISDQSECMDRFDAGAECRNQEIRADLLAIAAELEDAR